jgi:hypothetical protein
VSGAVWGSIGGIQNRILEAFRERPAWEDHMDFSSLKQKVVEATSIKELIDLLTTPSSLDSKWY